MGENGRQWLGKQSKCSKLVRKSSQLSQNVSKCPKMSTSDALLSKRTCFPFLSPFFSLSLPFPFDFLPQWGGGGELQNLYTPAFFALPARRNWVRGKSSRRRQMNIGWGGKDILSVLSLPPYGLTDGGKDGSTNRPTYGHSLLYSHCSRLKRLLLSYIYRNMSGNWK